MAVMVSTSVGDMVIDLFTDLCPLATKNFLKLCKIKYYNNCLFHSVQRDFIVQTGDPTGTGSGGDSIYKFLYGDQARYFDNEIHPKLRHDKVGVVAMASAGENANASQFYITTRAELDYLDGKHTVFGELAEGIDALERINETFVDEKHRPFKNIRIKHTHILDDPFDDPPELGGLIPDKSPELKPPAEGEEVRLEDDWVPMNDNMEPAELEKSLRRKEAQSRAVVLEMIGDLPEADMKPPENVLFVCKLNPVTEEGDLELIFGRFGKVMSADIIRDYKSGDSLCYAFIEFETPEACEAAYFKMDNVLIDDRRIHVDFSQSVSHLWNRYRKFGTKNGDDEGANFAPGQHDNGRGCFKCGEVGHFAKECPNNGEDQKEGAPERPKYSIKETGGQRGNMSRRYDMVFEEEEEVARKPRSGDRREGEKQVQSGSRGRRSAEDDGRNGRWDGGRGYSNERALHKHGQERLQEIDRDRSRASGSRAYHERENERESRREAGSREGGVREQAEKYDREYRREERNTRAAHERENERGSRREAGSREGGVREQEKKYDKEYKREERSPRRAREEEGLRKNAMKDRNSVVEREARKGGRVQAPSQERGAKRSDVVDKWSTGDDWREGSSGAGTGMRGSSEKDTDGAKHGDSRKVSNKSRREHLSSGQRSYQGSDYKRRDRDHGYERESDDAYSRRRHR